MFFGPNQISDDESDENEESGKSAWSELTDLTLQECEMKHLSPIVFDLFPSLRKFALVNSNKITKFGKTLFKNASGLLEMTFYSRTSIVLTAESFRGLENLQVLKLKSVSINSFKLLDALPILQELDLTLGYGASISRIEKFEASLPKLKIIKLTFARAELWIGPGAFDHLVSLERVEMVFEKGSDVLELSSPNLRYISCRGLTLLKFNSNLIEEIVLNECNNETRVETTQQYMNGFKKLTMFKPVLENKPFQQFFNLEFLSLKINNLSLLDNRQPFDCLSKLKELQLICKI
jgi:hypothetical protein